MFLPIDIIYTNKLQDMQPKPMKYHITVILLNELYTISFSSLYDVRLCDLFELLQDYEPKEKV